MDYYKLFLQKAGLFAGRRFLQLDYVSYSYTAVKSEMEALNEVFRFEGRNRVLVVAKDIYWQLCAFLFLQSQGQVPVLAHDDLPLDSIKQIMAKHEIKYLLTDMKFEGLVRACRSVTGHGTVELYEVVAESYLVPPEICMGVLSSGSTSVPKLFMRTYESWAGFFDEQNKVFGIDENSRVFIEGSLSFTGNLNVFAAVLYAGAILVVTRKFQCHYWERMLRDNAVSVIYMVPTKLILLARSIRKALTQVKTIFSGSQLIDEGLLNDLKLKLPQAEVILYYGATEVNYISYLRGSEISQHQMSVGRPFDGVEVTIRQGRIYIDSPYFVYGIERPYTVNDSGHFDADGYLIFQGRQENIINKGGFKVSCLKVEQALCSIDGINQAVVMSEKSATRGNELVAFIQADYCTSYTIIREELKKILQRTEIPKKILRVKEIPLNSLGKINREILSKTLTNDE